MKNEEKFVRHINFYCENPDDVLSNVKLQCENKPISFEDVSDHFVLDFEEMAPHLRISDFATYVRANIMAFASRGEL